MKSKRLLKGLGIAVLILCVFSFATCDWLDNMIAQTAEVGIYVGIISVNDSISGYAPPVNNLVFNYLADPNFVDNGNQQIKYTWNKDLILLNNFSVNEFRTFILPNYDHDSPSKAGGAKLYWGVNKAIKNLKDQEKTLQSKMNNVTIVTFTAGFDQESQEYAEEFDNPKFTGDYAAALKTKIRGTDEDGTGATKIKGLQINAYAVAIASSLNPTDQTKTLQNITSSDTNYYIADYAGLTAQFKQIAQNLNGIRESASLKLSVRGISSIVSQEGINGYNLAVTFDNKDPLTSAKMIQGKIIQLDNGKYRLTNIKWTGFDSIITEIDGIKNGMLWDFLFEGLGVDNTSAVKQYASGSNGSWQSFGESDQNTVSIVKGTKKSAVIYIVLDALIPESQIPGVRTAVADFIKEIYDVSNK